MDEQPGSAAPPPALPTGWPGWVLNGLAVVSAGGAYVVAAAAADTTGAARVTLLVVGGVLAAAVVSTQLIKQRRDAQQITKAREVAQEAKAAFGEALSGALAPITSYLSEMSSRSDRANRATVVGKLAQAIVDAAVSVTTPGARCAFYRYDEDGRRLVRETYVGRPSIPRQQFVGGTPDGDAVLGLVEGGDLVRIDDVGQDAMVTPTHPGDYQTVIAVAVATKHRRFGMLTLDAPLPGDLNNADSALLQVLANLLGAGLAIAE